MVLVSLVVGRAWRAGILARRRWMVVCLPSFSFRWASLPTSSRLPGRIHVQQCACCPTETPWYFFSCQSQLLIPRKLCWGTARHSKNEWDVPYIYLVGGVTVPAGHIVAQHWSGAPAALSALSGSHAAKLWSRPVRMQQEEQNTGYYSVSLPACWHGTPEASASRWGRASHWSSLAAEDGEADPFGQPAGLAMDRELMVLFTTRIE